MQAPGCIENQIPDILTYHERAGTSSEACLGPAGWQAESPEIVTAGTDRDDDDILGRCHHDAMMSHLVTQYLIMSPCHILLSLEKSCVKGFIEI